jgi:hypothetical protein
MESPADSLASDAPAPWWKVIVAGLPELVVGLQFLAMALSSKPLFGASAKTLTTLMQAEFLVIHSMAFLGLIGLWKPADDKGRQTRAVAFWGVFGLYCVMAASQGLQYFLVFFGLTFVTYLGLFMNWRSESALLQLGARWGIGLVVFLTAVGVFGTPKNVSEWTGRASVVRAGAAYFLVLAAIELSGLYLRAIPRHAGRLRELIRQSQNK